MKPLAAIIAFYLGCLAAVAMGAQTELADYHRAVVKVGQFDGRGGSWSGTGTVVCKENGGIILSVAHIFEGTGQCWVDFGGGRRTFVKLLGRDPAQDLAVLQGTGVPDDVPAIPLAAPNEFAPGGSQVEFIGYGGGTFRHFTANTVGYDPARPGAPILMDFVSISGDSGGPVVYQGKLVAVQWGHNGTHSMGSSCGKIQDFLTQYQIPQCQGGSCWRPSYQPIVRPAQPQQPAQPPLAKVPPKPCSCDNAALLARIEKLEQSNKKLHAELIAVKSVQPLKGDKGETGETGPVGPSPKIEDIVAEVVKQIPPPEIDIDDLASKLPPIRVRQIDRNGNVVVAENGEREEMNVRLGENLNLRYRNVDDAQLSALEERVRGLESE